MKIEPGDVHALEPVIRTIVRAVLDDVQTEREQFNGRLGYTEAEAATLIGVAKHVLRDCRLRGEIHGKPVGRKVVYSRDELARFLERRST
jgi:hypothetical protein